ncbi:hypothetical protein BJX68DRAFT_276626 [Aspergillus pseudodeflectus]|uniref:Acetoacetate decarboxylase n=1 Tax=Aspergillus pseudodeflectus TaxID=176178 RepID=A0ABR4L4F2_9EURO
MTDFLPTPPTPSTPGSSPTKSVPIAPPPWTLRSKSWTFLYTDIDEPDSPAQNPNNRPEILQDILPPGAYHPFETIHPEALQKLPGGKSQFREGWLKGIMIVRYEETDVGPYDELILIPGRAVNPHSGKAELRISTIYVSTDASVWNGRRNWNIPKHRAVFDFKPVGKSDLELRVYHPSDTPAPFNPKVPFFSALLKGSSLPRVPIPRMAPLSLVQPPLSRSRWPASIQDAAIATDDPENGRQNPWLVIKPGFKGKWGLAYAKKLEDGDETLEYHGDGVGFPRVKLWSVGSVFEGVTEFGVSKVVS